MAKVNIIAMRLGPGKHLKGRVLMDGLVKPEEVRRSAFALLTRALDTLAQFDYFHELIMGQECARINARGYYDGMGGGTYIGKPVVECSLATANITFRSTARHEFRKAGSPRKGHGRSLLWQETDLLGYLGSVCWK